MIQNWRTKEWLHEHYIVQKLSYPAIGAIVGKTANAIRFAARSFGITSRSVAEVTQKIDIPINEIIDLYPQGWSIADIAKHFNVAYCTIQAKMKKHGIVARTAAKGRSVSHVARHNLLPREQWADKHWLDTQYTSRSINEIAEEIGWSYTAVHDTMVALGVKLRDNAAAINKKWLDEIYRNKCLVYSPPKSKLQMKLYKLLDEIGVSYIPESTETKLLQHYRPLDCIIPRPGQKTLIIEVNGYLHLHPSIASKDRSKAIQINKFLPDHELVYVWDHDLASTDVAAKLCKLIGVTIPTHDYSLSDLSIDRVTYAQTKIFLDLYHYLGKGRGGICYGVWLNDKLIAVAVFSPPLRQNTAAQFDMTDQSIRELSRLCVHPLYRKKNLLSWFLSRVVQQLPCQMVVSYADTTMGHTGAVYKACNWQFHHEVPGDYHYLDSDGICIHKRTLYQRARAAKMLEADFAEYFGYIKMPSKPKLCFIWQR